MFYIYFCTGDGFGGCSNFAARLSLQPKLSRVSIASDELPTEFRRKSAGSPNATNYQSQNSFNNNNEPYIYAFGSDECERHPDGTVILRYDIFFPFRINKFDGMDLFVYFHLKQIKEGKKKKL